jgi:predicted ester cyclase
VLHRAFPDLQGAIEDVVAQDDKVAVRMTYQGTQTGPFLSMPPTGKPVAFEGFDIVRVVDGKIAEH